MRRSSGTRRAAWRAARVREENPRGVFTPLNTLRPAPSPGVTLTTRLGIYKVKWAKALDPEGGGKVAHGSKVRD